MSTERFKNGIESTSVSPCATCAHKNVLNDTCLAFKDGIPLIILTGGVSHRNPYPGDSGIVYFKK